jgi:hypothetical protein
MSPSRGTESESIEVRIRNNSNVDFNRVQVEFPDQHNVDYGSIPSCSTSGYQVTSRAYRYAAVVVETDGQPLTLQPIDYLGEEELPPGRYTYTLDVDNGQLTLELEKAD